MSSLETGKTLIKDNPNGRLLTLHKGNYTITLYYVVNRPGLPEEVPYSYCDCSSGNQITHESKFLNIFELAKIWYKNVDKGILDFGYLTINPDEDGLWTP